QFARQSRIANLLRVEVGDAYTHPVFNLEGADIMQERSPAFGFFEVSGDMLGKEDVPCVAAIHHPFCHVDSSAREIGPFIYIHNPAEGSAVDSHPNLRGG